MSLIMSAYLFLVLGQGLSVVRYRIAALLSCLPACEGDAKIIKLSLSCLPPDLKLFILHILLPSKSRLVSCSQIKPLQT